MGKRFHQSACGLGARKLGQALIALALIHFLTGLVWGESLVLLTVDGKSRYVRSGAQTVGELLDENGVAVKPFDAVIPDPSKKLAEGMAVKVQRAATIVVKLPGQEIITLSTATTVGEALDQLEIQTKPADRIQPHIDESLTGGLITVAPVRHELKVVRIPIPYRIEKRSDSKLSSGLTSVLAKGKNGVLVRLVDVVFEGDRPVRRALVMERVLAAPVTQVVRVGTAPRVAMVRRPRISVSRGGSHSGPVAGVAKVLRMQASAYVANYGPGVGSRTATGMAARKGVVAVDPRVIPLGTRLYIDGYGYAVAADTGSAIKGYRIDLCFNSVREALRFGRRTVTVRILD